MSSRTRRLPGDAEAFELVVDAADGETARACVAELDVPEADADGVAERTSSGKSVRVAWGMALLPGVAHLYAGANIRGVLLLIALFSTAHWASIDHMTAVAPLLLFLTDALGATALVRGAPSRARAVFALTAPLWVAVPAMLLQHAPDVYVGSSGRAVCAYLDQCGEPWPECEASIAAQIGYSVRVRGAARQCAQLLESQRCELLNDDLGPFHPDRPSLDACMLLFDGSAHFVYAEDDREDIPRPRLPQGWGM